MRLAQYLQDNGLSYREFARRIGTPHARTVERYAKGDRIPAGRMMAAIIEMTGGEVQAKDFVDPAPAVSTVSAAA